MKHLLLTLSLLFCCAIQAQQTTTGLAGRVTDASTGEPLPFVQVGFLGTTKGAYTDMDGRFSISNTEGKDSVRFQMMGYQPQTIKVTKGTFKKNFKLALNPNANLLKPVEITASKKQRSRYRRRNNPAVELVKKVIDHKEQNRMQAFPTYSRKAYEKTILALDDFYPDFENKRIWRKLNFIEKYIDQTPYDATPILTISMREKMMKQYHSLKPKQDRTLIVARRLEGVDQALDVEGIEQSLNAMFTPIDIYDNDIDLMLNHFTSPLNSLIATTFYRFFITDTTEVDGIPCVELSFVPSNDRNYGFTGQMYVALDSTYAITRYSMTVSKHVNLNFVRDLTIIQSFKANANNDELTLSDSSTQHPTSYINKYPKYIPDRCDAYGRLSIHKKLQEVYVHQVRIYFDHNLTDSAEALPDSLFPRFVHTASMPSTKWYRRQWNSERPIELTMKETVLDSLRYELARLPEFQFIKKTLNLFLVGYIPTSTVRGESRFDIGPIFNIFSFNNEEGFRIRLGGMTTARLSPRNFLDGYLAYGFRDRRPKFNATYTHSFNAKENHAYDGLQNQLSFGASYELENPGQSFGSFDRDNIWMSTKQPRSVQYVLQSVLRYQKAFPSHINIDTWLALRRYELAGTLQYEQYQSDGTLRDLDYFAEAEWKGALSFTPDLTPENRRPGNAGGMRLMNNAPTINISHLVAAISGGLRFQRTDFMAEKRFWLGAFGHIDARLQSGLVWGRAPYTRLCFPSANNGLYVTPNAFNTMRPMEFIVDQYVALFASYHLKGWILNNIPLINRLRLREVVGFNIIYGGLSARNNPNAVGTEPDGFNQGLFRLPDGVSPLGKEPYMEWSVGVENILKFIRIDYVRRMTYTDGLTPRQCGFIKIDLKFTL